MTNVVYHQSGLRWPGQRTDQQNNGEQPLLVRKAQLWLMRLWIQGGVCVRNLPSCEAEKVARLAN